MWGRTAFLLVVLLYVCIGAVIWPPQPDAGWPQWAKSIIRPFRQANCQYIAGNDALQCDGLQTPDNTANTPANFIIMDENEGPGGATCTSCPADKWCITDKDATDNVVDVVLCDGTSEVGSLGGASVGDISAVMGCASGDCGDIVADDGDSLSFAGITLSSTGEGLIHASLDTCAGAVTAHTSCYEESTDSWCIYDGSEWDCGQLSAHTVDTNTQCDETGVCSSIIVDGTTCLDTTSDRFYHDTNCNGTKEGGEEFIDQASGSATATSIAHFGFPDGTSAAATKAGNDQCDCYQHYNPAPITPDRLAVRIQTGSSDDTVQLGIFSTDGLTQYASCTLSDLTATDAESCTDASVTQLPQGDFIACYHVDDGANDTEEVVLHSPQSGDMWTLRDVTGDNGCVGGIGATVSVTITSAQGDPFAISIIDDP